MWIAIGTGAASAWVLSKVADGVTGWASAKVAEGVSGKLGRVIRVFDRQKRKTSHISIEPPEPPFTSRFATTRDDLDTVLELRRAFFRKHPVSPDSTYVRCWEKNKHSMKVVYRSSGDPVGYWAIIPIRKETFTQFIRGDSGISHADMLARHTHPWSPSVSCLYIIGAVVPVADDRKTSLGQGGTRWRVLADAFHFATEVMDRLPLRNICGYPSRTGGYDVLDLMGFHKTKVCIDDDASQPIFSVTSAQQLGRVRQRLGVLVDNYDHMLPAWETRDRSQFFDQIGAVGAA
jgi:hypothetical protein